MDEGVFPQVDDKGIVKGINGKALCFDCLVLKDSFGIVLETEVETDESGNFFLLA